MVACEVGTIVHALVVVFSPSHVALVKLSWSPQAKNHRKDMNGRELVGRIECVLVFTLSL